MPALVTHKFRIHNAKSFLEGFAESRGFADITLGDAADYLESNMYIFIGKVDAWSDESNPPSPTDSIANTVFENWRDMIAAKKVTSSDVSHVIPRYNWVSGTAYKQYTHYDNSLFGSQFYVMTDTFRVYKCLANNLGGGAGVGGNNNGPGGNSTKEPSGIGSSIIDYTDTSVSGNDGYAWKFMFEINASDALKFVTPNYIPVKRIRFANGTLSNDGSLQYTVENGAVDGQLNIINKTANGTTNYAYYIGSIDSANTSTIVIPTDASIQTDYSGGYVYISAGTGSGQLRTISTYNSSTRTMTLDSALSTAPDVTSTINISPKVTITGDGSGATAIAVADGTGYFTASVERIKVINNGSNYSTASITITDAGLSGRSTTGSGATAEAIIGPRGGHGYDAITELGGYYIMVNSRLEYSENNYFTTVNDFRKIGLVKDPLTYNTTTKYTQTLATQGVTLNTENMSGTFATDMVITGGTSGATGTVVDYTANSTVGVIRLVSVTGVFQASETVSHNDGGGGITSSDIKASNGIEYPDMEPYDGDILYVENRSPVTRATDQIEDIKLIIEF